jgi:hypothetical protein
MSHTIILAPFIFAFLTFFMRFYVRERAASMQNPSFILAAATVAIAALYLVLGVTEHFPPYGDVGFGVVGLALLGLAIARMFML